MNEKEALTRVKTGNFNGGYGFDMQLLVDAVGIIGEMFKSGQISEIVLCKDCKYWDSEEHDCNIKIGWFACGADWFCADGEKGDG